MIYKIVGMYYLGMLILPSSLKHGCFQKVVTSTRQQSRKHQLDNRTININKITK